MMNIIIDIDENYLKELFKQELEKKKQEATEPILMDTKTLMTMLKCSRPTAEKLYKNNPEFPAFKVGDKWLFPTEQVKQYLKSKGGCSNGNT
jgi:excisionase family DNA binding protein